MLSRGITNLNTFIARHFLRSKQFLCQVTISMHFMEPKGLLLRSQVPATCPWPEPDKSNQCHVIYFRSVPLKFKYYTCKEIRRRKVSQCPVISVITYTFFIGISLSTKVIFPHTGNRELKLAKMTFLNCVYFCNGVSTYDYKATGTGRLKPSMLQMSSGQEE